ncbi:hypothetical protein PGH43_01250 [Legionella pneumophila 130b]|nr:hypothetical protein PGH43_01250 [Legionella pneumophila 130b]
MIDACFKITFLTLALSGNLFAQDIKVVGTLNQTLKAPQNKTLNTKPAIQQIKLLKMQLSNSAIKALARKTDITLKKPNTITTSTALPSKVELGMNNVPVLNQGSFGTCVTFATTAAIDAALNKGDYISQLCQLQLGLYLEKTVIHQVVGMAH